MSFSKSHNIGAVIAVKRAAANTAVTAGGAGDNTLVTGVTIDLSLLNYPKSAVFALLFTATLAAGKSLFNKSCTIEHGAQSNLSDAAVLFTLEDSTGTAIATSAGGGTVTGEKEYDIDLAGAKQYIRIKFTPDMDASGTDTSAIAAAAVFGGSDAVPV
jgi:hypothetical protein